ncbi:MAG TPA: copper homeostasis periplasmic binding protein CopC [Burkholderiaceae bacterium]|nr:copper homeostasis periplasmic binding protein CopC [Burkholderiaceae bacterium]
MKAARTPFKGVRGAILAAACLGVSVWSQAHPHLLASSPAADAASPPSSQLVLKFSEGLSLHFSGAALKGSDGSTVPTGAARLDGKDDTTLVVPIASPLPVGGYVVEWHALSNDGHKTQGRYAFRVVGAP